MNGRVYDYNLGRFLSVDPFIQAPGNSQSLNPYSYIMNNPLAGTDPSGYLWLAPGSLESNHCSFLCMVGYQGFTSAGSNGVEYAPKKSIELPDDEHETSITLSGISSPSEVAFSVSSDDKATDFFVNDGSNLGNILAKMVGLESEEQAEQRVEDIRVAAQDGIDSAIESIDQATSEENLSAASRAMSLVAVGAWTNRKPRIAIIAKVASLGLGTLAALRSDKPGRALAEMIGLEIITGKSIGTLAGVAKGIKGDGPSVTKDLINSADELLSTGTQKIIKEELKNEQP